MRDAGNIGSVVRTSNETNGSGWEAGYRSYKSSCFGKPGESLFLLSMGFLRLPRNCDFLFDCKIRRRVDIAAANGLATLVGERIFGFRVGAVAAKVLAAPLPVRPGRLLSIRPSTGLTDSTDPLADFVQFRRDISSGLLLTLLLSRCAATEQRQNPSRVCILRCVFGSLHWSILGRSFHQKSLLDKLEGGLLLGGVGIPHTLAGHFRLG